MVFPRVLGNFKYEIYCTQIVRYNWLMMLMPRNVLASLVGMLNLNICQGIEDEVSSRFWSKFFVKTLKLNFGQDFEAEALSRFWGWI